jgi:hypothetical protein
MTNAIRWPRAYDRGLSVDRLLRARCCSLRHLTAAPSPWLRHLSQPSRAPIRPLLARWSECSSPRSPVHDRGGSPTSCRHRLSLQGLPMVSKWRISARPSLEFRHLPRPALSTGRPPSWAVPRSRSWQCRHLHHQPPPIRPSSIPTPLCPSTTAASSLLLSCSCLRPLPGLRHPTLRPPSERLTKSLLPFATTGHR